MHEIRIAHDLPKSKNPSPYEVCMNARVLKLAIKCATEALIDLEKIQFDKGLYKNGVNRHHMRQIVEEHDRIASAL